MKFTFEYSEMIQINFVIYSTECLYAITTEAAFCIRSTNHSKLQDKSELTLKVYFGKANEISIIRSGNAEKLYCNTKTFYTALTSCHKNPLEIQGRQKIIVLARTQIWLVRKKVTGSNSEMIFSFNVHTKDDTWYFHGTYWLLNWSVCNDPLSTDHGTT